MLIPANNVVFATLLLCLCHSLSVEASECFYVSKTDNAYKKADDCGEIEGGTITLTDAIFEDIQFDQQSLTCVIFPNQELFYINRNRKSQRVLFFDNGCDYFKQGFARGLENQRLVFIDQELNIKLRPKFEYLVPFDYGHAVVCNGPFTEEQHGEHTFLRGGQCGLIDKQGNLVVAAAHPIGESEAFDAYINNHNHCPPPPVTTAEAALCHAKRHVDNMDFHSAEWQSQRISLRGTVWLVSFIEKGESEEVTLDLDANSAHWQSLLPESHEEALQRFNDENHSGIQ